MAIRNYLLGGHFAEYPKELRIANALGEAFDITAAGRQNGLSFWLALPNEGTKQRFALNQELLVIYSPHKQTDARTLTTIEDISRNKDFKNRIDKVLILLIHCGDEVETRELVSNQTSWIIVPFTAAELTDPQRGNLFVRSRITEYAGAIDLFGMSSPIRQDKYLFGRDELIQSLSSRLIQQRENAGLFGLRKTGKTSVLYAIERRAPKNKVLISYLDCQYPAHHNARWWHFLQIVRDSLYDAARAQGFGVATPTHAYSETSTPFAADLKALLSRTRQEQAVIMMDEIEYITPGLNGAIGGHWDNDFVPFWQTVRATHQETSGQLTFILAGVNPAGVEQTHFGIVPNPIFQLATPHFLEPLSRGSVREMVRTIGRYTGLSFDEDSYTLLQTQYGGHPYLIRLACSEVWENANTCQADKRVQVAPETFASLHNKIVDRISRPLKDILLSLVWWYPDDYDLLRLAASGEQTFVKQYIAQSDAKAVLFARYGLLNPDSGDFLLPDLKDFLNLHGGEYKQEISPFRRSDLPPDIIPVMPDVKLLGRIFEKKCSLEARLRKLVLMYLGVRCNWKHAEISRAISSALKPRTDRKDPSSLFLGRALRDAINELYTSDLKQVIGEHWSLFSAVFESDKARFDMNLDAINKARQYDGHSKPITEKEVHNFENSFSWFDRCLANVQMMGEL